MEAPISVARAFLFRQTTLVPLDRPVAESMTVAKKDLVRGDLLDDFGGYTYHGMIEKAGTAKQLNALPVGLAPHAEITQAVEKGQIITWDHVKLDETQTVLKLRRQQDDLSD